MYYVYILLAKAQQVKIYSSVANENTCNWCHFCAFIIYVEHCQFIKSDFIFSNLWLYSDGTEGITLNHCYIIIYQTSTFLCRDDKGTQKNINFDNFYDISLQACRRYVFAVAISYKDLPDEKQLYRTTKEINTTRTIVRSPKFLSICNGNLVWQEDDGDCIDDFLVIKRYVCIFLLSK